MRFRAFARSTSPATLKHRAEIALFAIAFVCLGTWSWSYLDSHVYQAYENWRFDRELAARPAAPSAPLAPASQAGRPVVLPADEGSPTPLPRPVAAPPASAATLSPQPQAPPHPAPDEGEPLGRLEVPRLGLSVMVSEGVSSRTLRRSAGHIPGTALPGELGNVGIAGHRDTFFRPLKDIRKNDTLTLKTLDGTYEYVVDSTSIVTPDNVQVLDPRNGPTLTLVTCYPFYYVGSAPKRFIVQAHLAG